MHTHTHTHTHTHMHTHLYTCLTFIQVLCWGVRDMKKYQLLSVTSPLVEIECGGTVVRTQPIRDASKDPNFPDPIISFDVVSKDELYLIVKSQNFF